MKKGFSGVASRLSWELFKRSGKINYYLLYNQIENATEQTLELNSNGEREL